VVVDPQMFLSILFYNTIECQSSIPSWERNFSFLHKSHTDSAAHTTVYMIYIAGSFSGVPCKEYPVTDLYHTADEANPHPHITLLYDLF
jgi:hypothetical protein